MPQAEHGNVEEADKMFSAFAKQQKLKQCPHRQHAHTKTKTPPSTEPGIGSCASLGARAWGLWAARHS